MARRLQLWDNEPLMAELPIAGIAIRVVITLTYRTLNFVELV